MLKIIENYPNYAISNHGEVFNIARNRQLKCSVNGRGYVIVRLSNSGGSKSFTVHSLVAAAFFGDRPRGMVINHKNGRQTDNHVSNLEYCTQSENIIHAYALKRARFLF